MSKDLQRADTPEADSPGTSNIKVNSANTSIDINTNLSSIQLALQDINNDSIKINNSAKEIQEEIAKLVLLLQRIEKIKIKNSFRKTWWNVNIFDLGKKSRITKEVEALIAIQQLALRSLLKEKPDLPFAKYITIRIQRIINRYEFGYVVSNFANQFTYVKDSESVPLKVISGLITALLIVSVPFTLLTSIYLVRDFHHKGDKKLRDLNSDIKMASNDIKKAESQLDKLGSEPLRLPTGGSQERIAIANGFAQQINVGFQAQNLETKLNSLKEKQKTLREGLEVRKVELQLERANINAILHIILAITAGTLGSVVSILIRIEDFQNRKYRDKLVPFFIGAFKPVIGAAFGLFLLAIYSSDLIVLNLTSNKNENSKGYFIFMLAFVAGFSERLARDIIIKTEDAVTGSRATQQSINISEPVKSELIEDSQTKKEDYDNAQSSEKQDKLMNLEDPSLLNLSSQKPNNEKLDGF